MDSSRDSLSVSRETIDSVGIAPLFPDHQSIKAYVDLLASLGVDWGLIGPREAARLWSRHIANCAVIAPALRQDASVCDVGSGAGLPGVVLALARPDLRVCLVEPLLRRTDFLTDVVSRLELANVEVVRARAEELHGTRTFDIVTSRAVAPLDRLLRWCWPLVGESGEMVAIKGARAGVEVESQQAILHRRRLVAQIDSWGADVVDPPTTVIRIQSASDAKED